MTLKKHLVIYLFALYFARKHKFKLYSCKYWTVLHIPNASSARTRIDVVCCLAYFLKQLQIQQPYYCCALWDTDLNFLHIVV